MAPYIRAPKSCRNSTLIHPTQNVLLSPISLSPILSQPRRQTTASPIMGSVLLTKQLTQPQPSQRTPPTTITNGSLTSFRIKSSHHLPRLAAPSSIRPHLPRLAAPSSIRPHLPRPATTSSIRPHLLRQAAPSSTRPHISRPALINSRNFHLMNHQLPLLGLPSTTSGSFYLTTKLLQSIRSSNVPMMSSLLAVMTPDQVNHSHITGETPLHEACKTANVAAVRALLKVSGIHMNAEDNFGYTPVMLAAYCCHVQVLHLLLDIAHLDLAPHLEQVAGSKPGLGREKRMETLEIIRAARTRRDRKAAEGEDSLKKDEEIIVKTSPTKSNMAGLFSFIFSKLSIKSLFQYPMNQAKKLFRQTFKRTGSKLHFRRRFGSKGYRLVQES